MMLVTETTFTQQVLRATLPVLACFGMKTCPARRAMQSALEGIAPTCQDRLLIAMVIVDRAPLLTEQYGITASPTLIVFQDGEPQGRVVGFIPDGLVQLFVDDVARGAVSGNRFWSPVEEIFEDAVVIPLLQRWDFSFRRQVPCATTRGSRQYRGRVDLLVYDHPLAQPITLIESKRQIRGDQDLQQAIAQAASYARGLWLSSFVVAAPRGLWLYRRNGEHVTCVKHFTSLEIHQKPDLPQQLLLQLRSER
jgi:thioredoxin 1